MQTVAIIRNRCLQALAATALVAAWVSHTRKRRPLPGMVT
jgi:hypothetical protein